MNVISTVVLPYKVTMNSIFADLMTNPEYAETLKPLIETFKAGVGTPEDGASEDAANPVTDNMLQALIAFTPLRSLMSFSNGQIKYDDLVALVNRMNGEA